MQSHNPKKKRLRHASWTPLLFLLLSACSHHPPPLPGAAQDLKPHQAQTATEASTPTASPPQQIALESPHDLPPPPFTPAEIEGAAHSFLAYRYDGQYELRSTAGVPIASGRTQAFITAVFPLPTGWCLATTQPQSDGEVAAIQLLSIDGQLSPPVQLADMIWSAVQDGDSLLVGLSNGSALRVTGANVETASEWHSPTPNQPLYLQRWAETITPCQPGSLAMLGEPLGMCTAPFGSLQGAWQVPPIQCGPYLVMDERPLPPNGPNWTRTVLALTDGEALTRNEFLPEKAQPRRPDCINDTLLLDTSGRGSILQLPTLTLAQTQVCPEETRRIAASPHSILCLGKDNTLALVRWQTATE